MIAINPLTPTASTADTREQSRLTDAAQQFEAVFLQDLLKAFQQQNNDGEEKSPGADIMSSFGTEAVAKAISKGGGMGIARQVVAKVELERHRHQNGTIDKP